MKRLTQKGFSAVEGLLILVIVGIIGGAGFYVYKSKQEANKSQDNSNKSSQEVSTETQQEEQPVDETAAWLLYEPPGKEYSVRLPDGWTFTRHQKDPNLYAFEASKTVYKQGVPAKVEEVTGGRDFSTVSFMIGFSNQTAPTRGTVGKKFKTNQGADVQQRVFTQTAPEDAMDLPKGATEYRYDLTKDGKSVVFRHDVKTGETEQTARVEQVIKTFELK